jgi:nitric oxide reductase subunit B
MVRSRPLRCLQLFNCACFQPSQNRYQYFYGCYREITVKIRSTASDSIDPVSDILKWVLLAVAVTTFAVLVWTVGVTYKEAPPFPDRFITADGALLMSAADIQAGKSGFQKADLMDYGSLYGMGSYFGPDYKAQYLVQLGKLTEENIAKNTGAQSLLALTAERRAGIRVDMQSQLQQVDLRRRETVIPRGTRQRDQQIAN